MRRMLGWATVLGVLGGFGAGVMPASAVPGAQYGLYYEVYVGGERVAEFPGNLRVFTECEGVVGPVLCSAFLGAPPQSAAVFAGDTRVEVSAHGEEADY